MTTTKPTAKGFVGEERMQSMNAGQRSLAIGFGQARAQAVNVEGMEVGVRHLGSQLAHLVRRTAAMPSELRPEVPKEPMDVQIATLWKAYAVYSRRVKAKGDDAESVERVRYLMGMYEELARVGCKLTQADGLKERHVKILLERWREAGLSVNTIRKRWSYLKIWTLALGKPGMVGRLEHYWPEIQKVASDGKRAHAAQVTNKDWSLTSTQMTDLMRSRDQTHWYVERLVESLGLSQEEALTFDSVMATNYLAGRLVIRSKSRREFRSVKLDSHEKTILVQEVQAFIKERGRARLMWPDMKPAEAVRKHQNRIAYMRRKHQNTEHGSGQSSDMFSGNVDGDSAGEVGHGE